jgi:Tol biopolymer transport system component
VPVANVDVIEAVASRDGQWLVYNTDPRVPDPGIYALRLGDTTPTLLVPGRSGEGDPRLSPDGRWLAYTSRESGRLEVYVRPFPDAGSARWQVSVEGGASPRWAPDSRELYFLAGDPSRVMAVSVARGPTFVAGEPRTLFELGTEITPYGWDLATDGRRFVMVRTRTADAGSPERTIVVVENFVHELRSKLGQ